MTALLENHLAELVTPPTALTGSPAERVAHPTPADLSRVWSGAVFAAIAALQAQLTAADPAVARAAANSILDLEKTRLRHGRELAGGGGTPARRRRHGRV